MRDRGRPDGPSFQRSKHDGCVLIPSGPELLSFLLKKYQCAIFQIDMHRYGSGSYFQRASKWNTFQLIEEKSFIVSAKISKPFLPLLVFPDGWYLQKDALFKYFPTNKTWRDAKNFCQSIGGDLATISDADQNEFVYRNLIPPAKHNLSNGEFVFRQNVFIY